MVMHMVRFMVLGSSFFLVEKCELISGCFFGENGFSLLRRRYNYVIELVYVVSQQFAV